MTIRLPDSLVASYDSADGNRSALMRRRLSEAVEDGELSGVPDDLQTLAEVEAAVDAGKLTRRRATFKARCHDYFFQQWESGGVTGYDADMLAEAWRTEAAIFGEDELAFVEAVVDWYQASYEPAEKPPMPSADHFIGMSDPDSVQIDNRLYDLVQEGLEERGLSKSAVIERLGQFHPDDRVMWAVEAVAGGKYEPE